MLKFVYKAKIKTAASALIVCFVFVMLLQGVLAIYNIYDSRQASLRISSLLISKDMENITELFSRIDSFVKIMESDENFIYLSSQTLKNDIVEDSKQFNALYEKFNTMASNSVQTPAFYNSVLFLNDELPLSYVAPNNGEYVDPNLLFGESYVYSLSSIKKAPWMEKLENSADSLVWVEEINNRYILCLAKKLSARIVENSRVKFYPLGVFYVSYDLFSLLNQLRLSETYKTYRITLSYNDEIIYETETANDAGRNNSINQISSIYPGFNIIASISDKEVNSPFLLQLLAGIISIVFTVLSGLLMLSYMNNAVISPIMHMSRHFMEDKHSELTYKKPLNPEVDVLYKNHNYMVERTRKAMEESRKSYYKMLQSQINPHFTYNVLNTISAVSLMKGDNQIAETISSLVAMLRYGINSPEELAELKKEIDIIKNFVAIQNFRYSNNISVEYQIPNELMNVKMPKLTLQPLVENSIFHNEKNPALNKVVVKLTAEIKDGKAVIKIKDNNLIDPEVLNSHLLSAEDDYAENRRGIGIRNINQRLLLIFGSEYELRYIKEDGTLCAVVTVPYTN